jgi:hypothetical protein
MLSHRAGRVLSFFSFELGLPQPLTRTRVPPPLVPGERHTRWRERGREIPNSDEGTYTVVLSTYMYFVSCPYHFLLTVGESAYDEKSVQKVQRDPMR